MLHLASQVAGHSSTILRAKRRVAHLRLAFSLTASRIIIILIIIFTTVQVNDLSTTTDLAREKCVEYSIMRADQQLLHSADHQPAPASRRSEVVTSVINPLVT